MLQIETPLAPDALLDAVQQVEAAMGRTRALRWGPRTIDIDLLLYGDRVVVSDRLRIPHPELPRRRFALVPLTEIDPRLCLPDGRAIVDLLGALGDTQIVRRLEAR